MPAANPPHELLYIYSMPEKSQNENRKAKKTKPPENLDSMRVPAVRPAPRDTKNEKRMRKKIVHPWQHERAITVIPSPSLRCAACAAAGAGVHTTVYIKPPPAPADRDAAKGIQKKEQKKCTRYCIHHGQNCVHTTVYNAALIMYTLPCTQPGGLCIHYRIQKERHKKKKQKRQARVYTNGRCVRQQGQAGGSKLGCTKKKRGCSPAGAGGRKQARVYKKEKKLYTLGWLVGCCIGCWSIR